MNGSVALILALPEEARGILAQSPWQRISAAQLPAVYRSCAGYGEGILAVTGIGRSCAEVAAHRILAEYSPVAALSLGFAGGLVSGLPAGDLVICQSLLPSFAAADGSQQPDPHRIIHCDRFLADAAQRIMADLGLRHRPGIGVTAAQTVASPESKQRLGRDSGALAVDEESFWVGLACQERKVPFLAVRAIVDAAEQRLPDIACRLAADAGSDNRWRRALPALLQPGQLPALIRLARDAAAARNSLTAFAGEFLDSRLPAASCPPDRAAGLRR